MENMKRKHAFMQRTFAMLEGSELEKSCSISRTVPLLLPKFFSARKKDTLAIIGDEDGEYRMAQFCSQKN